MTAATPELVDCIPPHPHPDSHCERIGDAERRLDDGSTRMQRIEDKLDKNSEATKEVLDILLLAKSFIRIMGIVGNIVKWAAAIAAPVIAVWLTLSVGGRK